jgi:hypothetical protein
MYSVGNIIFSTRRKNRWDYVTTNCHISSWCVQGRMWLPCWQVHQLGYVKKSKMFRKSALTLILLMLRIGWANSIPIYIQQDATLHNLFISGNCSTCFGWYFHPSSGAHTPVSTASVICHTVVAICRYRGRVGTGLSVLWLAYATHSTLKPLPTDSGR